MIVAVHQPNYLPYIGFFHKMALADTFVLYDTAQFSKNDFHNRNRVKTPRGPTWLTIPVRHPTMREIRHVGIDQSKPWADRHWQTIEANYSRAPCFGTFANELRALYKRSWTRLGDASEDFIVLLAKGFGLRPRFERASALDLPAGLSKSARLVEIVRRVGGDVYLSGPGGRDYLDSRVFTDIRLQVQDFHHPAYPQLWGTFLPNLSAIDFLLNVGSDAEAVIARSGSTKPWE